MRKLHRLIWTTTLALAAAGPAIAARGIPTLADHLPSGLLLEPESGKALPPPGESLRKISAPGLALTEAQEGWVASRYNDAAGYCTIGYGHLIKKARCNGHEPPEFLHAISRPTGARLLGTDMTGAEVVVMTSVEKPLSDPQFAALCDFVFNIGGANFRSSTLLKRINLGQFDDVPAQMARWNKAGGKTFPGLVKRRKAEIALFFTGLPTPKALPSPDEDLSPIDISKGEQTH